MVAMACTLNTTPTAKPHAIPNMRTKPILALATSSGSRPPSHVPTDCVIAGLPYWSTSAEYPRQPLPTRDEHDGTLLFPDQPNFRPNVTPKDVLCSGAFGGTYYRPITSKTAKCSFPKGVHLEYPPDWYEGDVSKTVTSETYRASVNKYGVKSGNDLDFWEGKGWMRAQDPYGWFQWYCRFYLGRRSEDDERQISRWIKAIGPKGRWRTFLVGQCVKKGAGWDDHMVSPATRQTLLHWGYELNKGEFDRLAEPIRNGKSVIYMGKVKAAKTHAREDSDADSADADSNNTSSKRRQSKRQRGVSK